MGPLWIGLGIWWLACAGLGWYVSAQRGRDISEGFLLGLLFGPLGVVVALFLPTIVTLHPRLRTADRDTVAFDCPLCGNEARANAGQGGQLATCGHCGSRLRIPLASGPAPLPEVTTFVPARPGSSAFPLPASRYLQGDVIVWICRCGEERMARRDQPGVTSQCRKCGTAFEIPG